MRNMFRKTLVLGAIVAAIALPLHNPVNESQPRRAVTVRLIEAQGSQQRLKRSLEKLKSAFEEEPATGSDGGVIYTSAYPKALDAMRNIGKELRVALCTGADVTALYKTVGNFDWRFTGWVSKYIPYRPVDNVRYIAWFGGEKGQLDEDTRLGALSIILGDLPVYLYERERFWELSLKDSPLAAKALHELDQSGIDAAHARLDAEITLGVLEFQSKPFTEMIADTRLWAGSVDRTKGATDKQMLELFDRMREIYKQYVCQVALQSK